jgi:hypothetical protein
MSDLSEVQLNGDGSLTIPGLYVTGSMRINGAISQGKVYFVDNVAGSDSTGSGTQASPYASITKAAAVGTAWQALQANPEARYTVFVNGTSAPYLAEVPVAMNFADVIGVGSNPRGSGTSIVRICGATAAVTDATVVSTTHAFTAPAGGMRGVNFANIQFEADTGFDCFHAAGSLLRCNFRNCAFMGSTGSNAQNGAVNAGILTVGSFAGSTVKDCHFGTNGGSVPVYGIYVTTGASANNLLIEDNTVTASAGGIYFAGTGDDSNSTVRRNSVHSGSAGALAVGIRTYAYAMVTENMIVATDCIDTSGTTALKCVNNHEIQNGTAAIEYAAT